MTNEEKLKGMATEELAKFLCCKVVPCNKCPGSDYCYAHSTDVKFITDAYLNAMGLQTWLKKEFTEE